MIRRTGNGFDGSTVHITVGRVEIVALSIGYGDNVEKERIYRLGQQTPSGSTPGQYKPEDGTLKMSSTVARRDLFPLLPQFGAANVSRLWVVTRTHPDIGTDSDALVACSILGAKEQLEASAKNTEIEMKLFYDMVLWTDKRICFGNPRGSGVVGNVRI